MSVSSRKFLAAFYHKPDTLSYSEQIYLHLLVTMPITHICSHLNLVAKYGTALVIPFHGLMVLTLTIPIAIAYNILGFITKRSFISYWDKCRILKGISFVVFINIYFNAVRNMSYISAFVLILIKNLNGTLPGTKCQFHDAPEDCIPSHPGKNYTKVCCENRTNCKFDLKFSTLEYFKAFHYANPEQIEEEEHHTGVHLVWILTNTVIILIIMACMFLGLPKLRKIFRIMNYYFSAVAFIWILYTIILSKYHLCPSNYVTNFNGSVRLAVFLEILGHALYYERPGEIIYLGSMSSMQSEPISRCLIIYFIKVTVLNLFVSWLAIGHFKMKEMYLVSDDFCLNAGGFELLFGILPDIISNTRHALILLVLYYASLAIYNLQYVVLLMLANVNTLTSTFKILERFQILLILGSCSVVYFAILAFEIKSFFKYFQLYRDSGYWSLITPMMSHFCAFLGLAIYSTQRISNDYLFMYGKEPNYLSKVGFKLAIYLSVITFITFLNSYRNFIAYFLHGSETGYSEVLMGSIVLVTLSPFFIYAIYAILKSIVLKKNYMLTAEDYGPLDPEVLAVRYQFSPQTKARYFYVEVQCRHACLLYSLSLADEQFILEEKARILENLYMNGFNKSTSVVFAPSSTIEFQGLHEEFEMQKERTRTEVIMLRKLEAKHLQERKP